MDYLLARLAAVEARVRSAVEARRGTDPDADDPFRGLYLSDAAVRRLLDAPDQVPWPDPVAAPATGDGSSRLELLQRDFGLQALDVELLLIALAPDVDRRFEQLYGYLNDDVTRRRPSIGLALGLCAVPAASAAARARLSADGPLAARGLLLVEEPERPFLGRSLRVPDRVAAHLLGGDAIAPELVDLLRPAPGGPGPDEDSAARLAGALLAGISPVYVREPPGGAAAELAAGALAGAGRGALVLDLARLERQAEPVPLVRAAGREAALAGAGLIAAPVDALAQRPELLRALAALPVPVVLSGQAGWNPQWSDRAPLLVEAERLGAAARAALWTSVLGAPPGPALAAFVLSPEQMRRAVATARQQAALAGTPGGALDGALDGTAPGEAELLHGARAQSTSGLERLARRIQPGVGWPDLVLPPPVLGQLRELAARARHRDRVLGDWAMRPGGGRGRGVMALFAGDSGTGKTMSAEVIAGELGLDLYTVDLATVVDKYVGETEKNLERIFTEAAGVNGVLLFDEADAVFGKRSEVKDAHDRYANVESAYLLQRMESFDGLAVLATNLRANLDEAFTRRLDLVVDFPLPDAEQRLALWDRCLGPRLPRGDDLDLPFCAKSFELAGGDIRSAAVTAAYLAAEADRPVTMADLVAAVAREYRKLGRLCLESEFGPYLRLAR
ncbi:ATP-binding protein [Streptomyces sp. NPDC051183]|uniref:ATP-binding protein n=1 Tax=unclassified Streptomyces TaxID=2593676 RepID=UPI003421C758